MLQNNDEIYLPTSGNRGTSKICTKNFVVICWFNRVIEHAGSWESNREVRRARGKLGERAGSWESTREIKTTRGKLGEHGGS